MVPYLWRGGNLNRLNGEVSLALEHRADAVQLPLQVLVPRHLHPLFQEVAHAHFLAGQRRAAGLLSDLDLADATLAGAVLQPEEDQQVQVA
jgi:hypothetical protein